MLAIGSDDGTTKICAFTRFDNLKQYSIGGNTRAVAGVFFSKNSLDLCIVSNLLGIMYNIFN